MNLAAHTFAGFNYPAFISINQDGGEVTVTVRSCAHHDGSCGDSAHITLDRELFAELIAEALKKLKED
jgi:tRNA(Phe) wybutosine-synthesizing methylase Tyw3